MKTIFPRLIATFFLWFLFLPSFASAQSVTFLSKFGSFGAGNGQFDGPQGLAINAGLGYLYVSEFGNNRIQCLNLTGSYLSQFGAFGTADGQTANPKGLAVRLSTNHVYVADQNGKRIQRFDASDVFQLKWGSNGSGNGQFSAPTDVAVNQSTGNVYVTDLLNNNVQRFDADGVYLGRWGSNGTGPGQFEGSTYAVAVNSTTGQVYVSDFYRIQRFSATGVFELQWGSQGNGQGQFKYPIDIAVDPVGRVYVSDSVLHRVQRFSPDGVYQMTIGSQGSGDGEFQNPNGIAISNDGVLYVVDGGNQRVQRFQVIDLPNAIETAIDLGTISNTSNVYEIADKTKLVTFTRPAQVAWYKFNIAGNVDDTTGRFLDIATEPIGSPTTFPSDDTEMGLYRADGTLVAMDDDRSVSFYSQFSFNQLAPVLAARGPLTAATFADGTPASGQDGPLSSGTYYLAVTGWDAVFDPTAFGVRTTASTVGTFKLTFRTDLNHPPTLDVNRKSIVPTSKKKIVIRGTVSDADGGTPQVFVKVGRAKFRPAKASGLNWKFVASLAPGRNIVKVYAIDEGGLSSSLRNLKISRK